MTCLKQKLSTPGLHQSFQALELMGSEVLNQEWNSSLHNVTVHTKMEKNEATHDNGDSRWQDLPMELLVRILMLVDDHTVIIASGVCTGWRDSICIGILNLSLLWCKQNMSKLVQSIAAKFTHLQVLNLRQKQPQLNDEAVEMVAKNCQNLRVLDLSNSSYLTDASLYALALGCTQLEKLNISGCSGITDSTLIFLAEKCNKLRHLNLCGCVRAASDRALLALAHNCHGLQSLNLGWCERVTDVGVTGLAQWCPELRAVDLCGCILIRDESVVALADKCHHLRSLGLYYCQNITDIAMYSLANSSKPKALKAHSKLNTGNSRCNSESISRAAVTRSGTQRWGISTCGISDRSAATSRDYMESVLNDQEGYGLVQLNISQCTSLTAPAVQAVCDSFPDLHTCSERHSLIISGCLNLTSVHCVCAVEAHRERRNRAASYAAKILNAR